MASDDGTLCEGQALKEFSDLILQASINLGRPLNAASSHRETLIKAGYIDVTVLNYKWPTNRWPKDPKKKTVGLWTLANIGSSLEGLCMALMTRGLDWSKERVLAFLVDVRKDLHNTKIHAYWPIWGLKYLVLRRSEWSLRRILELLRVRLSSIISSITDKWNQVVQAML
ncbi:hypothetical protein PABG_12670 [Paracoccidioides brasiliensis Pb03]|nr:hypothetical protein PABG_12670 [Paracoccidioides brasiliensis Pb03]